MAGAQSPAMFYGSRISLISKSDIRYEGILYSINAENATVALSEVRSFGTEGRKGGGAEEIPPQSEVYDYIIFRGSDIKDLNVLAQEPSPPAPAPAPYQDPAIVSMNAPQGPPAPAAPPQLHAPPPYPPYPATPQYTQPSQQQKSQAPQQQRSQGRANRGRGNNGGGRGAGRQTAPVPPPQLSEFDFASNNARFDKDKIATEMEEKGLEDGMAALAVEGDEPEAKEFYSKSSFFDNISCETKDRAEGRDGRAPRAELRQLDIETFGTANPGRNRRYFRRGARGGGGRRGGRGGGQGRGDASGRGGGRRRHRGNGNGGTGKGRGGGDTTTGAAGVTPGLS